MIVMLNFLKKNQKNNDSVEESKAPTSWLQRLSQGFSKTRKQLSNGLTQLFSGSVKLDDDTLEKLETHLLLADVGIEATTQIIETLKTSAKQKNLLTVKSYNKNYKIS